MAYTVAHQAKQRNNLLNTLYNVEFCDVTFIIGSVRSPQSEVFANRMLLASISPVFKAMLYGNMKEGQINAEIVINDIDTNAFKSVLKYAYGNDPDLTADSIIPIRYICEKYQISLLSEMCDEYFPKIISPSNVCSLLNRATNMHLKKYQALCMERLTNKFAYKVEKIIESVGFLDLNFDAIQEFLQSDNLNITEEKLFEAVLKWVHHQITKSNQKMENDDQFDENARDDFKNEYADYDEEGKEEHNKLLRLLCPYIRFGLMNGKYLVKKVKPLNCLTLQQFTSILCYKQCADEGCGGFSTKPRSGYNSYCYNGWSNNYN